MRAWLAVVPALLMTVPAFAEESDESSTSDDTIIRVTSDPAGAEISIDGHDCGVTPTTLAVSPGSYRVSVSIGDRRMQSSVTVEVGELAEVHVELGGEAPVGDDGVPDPFARIERREETPPVQQLDDDERYRRPTVEERDREERGGRRDERRGRRRREEPEEEESWARNVHQHPLFELSFLTAPINRYFAVSIDPSIDTNGRQWAEMDTGAYGLIGFRLSLFPFFRVRRTAARGLGLEFSAGTDVGLTILNRRRNEEVDAAYTEGELLLVYNLVLGRPDAGATVMVRFGWHRTEFFLGDVGNDIIPPFVYDTLRIDGGVRVPLGTRHVLIELGWAYLPVLDVGAHANTAYNESGSQASSHGGELRAGIITRVGGLEVSWLWIGRMYSSEFTGTGFGWGYEPTTRMDTPGGRGIATLGPTDDNYHQARLSVGYRW